MPNPVIETIDLNGAQGKAAGYIAATTNAGFTQQAVVTVTDSKGNTVASGTFQGNGENNTPMPLTSGGHLLQFSGATIPLTLNIQCSYDPNGTFQPNAPNKVVVNQLVDNPMVETYQVTAEDYVDNDFNDTILTATFIAHA